MKTLRKLLEIVLNELYDQIEESERYYNWYLEEKDKNEVLAEENNELREKLRAYKRGTRVLSHIRRILSLRMFKKGTGHIGCIGDVRDK